MKYRKLGPRYRYVLTEDCYIPVTNKRLCGALYSHQQPPHPFFEITPRFVLAKAGYAWDGATGALKNGENLVIPSLIHDIGCQAVNLKLLPTDFRPKFDLEYYQQCRLYGVLWVRAKVHYLAISLWGKIPKKKGNVAPYAVVHSLTVLGS